ncbi:hypothetical protein, conserved [Plasmodium gonderi]|uniref:Protein FAM32A n=1 Tax=Plasmodium gonderi TaxID=77519 RepID=A0A1Y1JR48_PLAGO|nr:hypothetical protein, conserved [Plasmodium gonderi]GAW83707.1 hypothetical protein, conserved [Plasmodium gonderi]
MKDSEFVGGKLKLKVSKIKKGNHSKHVNHANEQSRKEKKKKKKIYIREEKTDRSSDVVENGTGHYNEPFFGETKSHDMCKGGNISLLENEEGIVMDDNKEMSADETKLKEVLQLNLTESEKAYQLVLKKREKQRIENILKESYRERLQKFNDNLASLSEHFDIPKVGPG